MLHKVLMLYTNDNDSELFYVIINDPLWHNYKTLSGLNKKWLCYDLCTKFDINWPVNSLNINILE